MSPRLAPSNLRSFLHISRRIENAIEPRPRLCHRVGRRFPADRAHRVFRVNAPPTRPSTSTRENQTMPQYMRTVAFIMALSVPIVPAATAFGAECDQVAFPDRVTAGDADLMLNGLGLRKAPMLSGK